MKNSSLDDSSVHLVTEVACLGLMRRYNLGVADVRENGLQDAEVHGLGSLCDEITIT